MKTTTKTRASAKAKKPTTKAKPTKTKKITTTDTLNRMLDRANGASMDDLVVELGLQRHTIRAMISTARKKRGIEIKLAEGRYRAITD
jgi:biotin operon repressor